MCQRGLPRNDWMRSKMQTRPCSIQYLDGFLFAIVSSASLLKIGNLALQSLMLPRNGFQRSAQTRDDLREANAVQVNVPFWLSMVYGLYGTLNWNGRLLQKEVVNEIPFRELLGYRHHIWFFEFAMPYLLENWLQQKQVSF
ncbi:hypothetical protein AKJ16_DCAP03359 [Drosera capensis]